MNEPIKIAVSVGELSGDQHAANLVSALCRFSPNIQIKGMGGRNLRAAGVDTVVDSERSASVHGFNIPFLVLKSLGAAFAMIKLLFLWRPHALIVTDYPDFNLRLAKIAARFFSIPVLYYIPPKVWAWRSGRVKTMKKVIDTAGLIFPFEREFYEGQGYDRAVFVGHPFVDSLSAQPAEAPQRADFLETLGLSAANPVLAVFPGSRPSEVIRHLPIMLQGLEMLRARRPETQVVMALAPSVKEKKIARILRDKPWLKVARGHALEVMSYADAGLLKSGTCNLEAAFLGLPFACFYTTPKYVEYIVRALVRVKNFSLVNLIREDTVEELVQQRATPANVADELEKLLFDSQARGRMKLNLQEVVQRLSSHDEHSAFGNCSTAAERAAKLALELALKKKSRSSVRQEVFKFLKPYRRQFAAALCCMVVFGASDGFVPFLVKNILDGIFKEQNRRLLVILPVILMIFAVVRAAAEFGQQFLMARVGLNIIRDMRNRLNSHILRLSSGFFLTRSSGNLLSHFTSDVLLVKDLLTNCVASVIRDSIRIVALLTTAVYLDPKLALIAFVIFPIGILPVYNFGRRMRKLSKRGQDAIGSLSGLVQESVLGNRVVKIFGREEFEQTCFEAENEKLNSTFIKSERVRALTGPVNEIMGSFAICGVLLYGGFSVINGVRSQGDFIAFLLAVFLLYDPFKKLSQVNNQVQQGISGAERIYELLNTVPEIQDPHNPIPLGESNEIEFEHVTFSYGAGDQQALRDVSLKVREGQKIAIVGFSGAGKSTLIDLIPRFIDPQGGVIKIGGVDIKQVTLSELRARIALVGQHTFLFNDTVYNNIAYGAPHASSEEIIAAAKSAFAYDFIMKMPRGFETLVGESGMTLSGGERQRIAIARAILKSAPILILDEATASLDNKSEREVQAAIEKLEENKTSLVIAHRLSTVRKAELIVVLEGGKIVEYGSHADLLARGGAFARLHALQFTEQAGQQAA